MDLERSVLGAIILESNSFYEVQSLLFPELFSDSKHKAIMSGIIQLKEKGLEVDYLSLHNEVKPDIDLHYLTKLTNQVASSANLETHCRILQQKWIENEARSTVGELWNEVQSSKFEGLDVITRLDQTISNLTDTITRGSEKDLSHFLHEFKEKDERIKQNETQLSGVPTPFSVIDKITGGWQDGDLILLGANTSMGKTSLALQCFSFPALRYNIPTLFFSLEQNGIQIVQRIFGQEEGVSSQEIREGISHNNMGKFNSFCSTVEKKPLHIIDKKGLNISEVKALSTKYTRQKNIRLIVIDYLQLIKATRKGHSKEDQIAEIGDELFNLSKTLNIPIIALAQLNREPLNRGGERTPAMHDIRYSDRPAQNADLVLLLNRPEYHGIQEDEEGNSTNGLAKLDFAKHRNGGLPLVKLRFQGEYMKFSNWNEQEIKPF